MEGFIFVQESSKRVGRYRGMSISKLAIGLRLQADSNFVSTWETTTPSETITLPLRSGYNYNATVDWGDGSSSAITSDTDPDRIHTYTTAGTYTVRISGVFETIYFANGGDKLKIKDITNWGPIGWTSLEASFYGCSNMAVTASDVPDLSGVTSLKWTFFNCSLANPNVTNWDVSTITTMERLFHGCNAAQPDVSGWDVSAVNIMFGMFAEMAIADPDVSLWDVSSVTNFALMFDTALLADPDVSSWVTTAATAMYSMFERAPVCNPDVSGFDTSSVTSMDDMFLLATLANPDMSAWDITSNTRGLNTGGSSLSTANYEAALINFDSQVLDAASIGFIFDFSPAQYNVGAPTTAKLSLVAFGWVITDGGQI
jgi:hypothetical protein